jgi:hypothetical protein
MHVCVLLQILPVSGVKSPDKEKQLLQSVSSILHSRKTYIYI